MGMASVCRSCAAVVHEMGAGIGHSIVLPERYSYGSFGGSTMCHPRKEIVHNRQRRLPC